ncbi:serine/threonine-protein phosphatase 6 regulatory ankyrin repeat subunit A-like [Oscarella lobularis]|uniref:serine/threonine-protein phosphatase 6 regulatory ankyrin repeat subunit A-like n=1 Tax=Oscarella lobularis TaxID=121494 RepID=UPI00331385B9
MGHASVCESLIMSGADVSERDEDGSQPIHLAARNGHVDVCKILLENKADVRAKGRNGFHLLHEASLKGHASMCEYLITSARADVCASDNDRNHPLHFAATNGHIDVCKILIENNANVLAKGYNVLNEDQALHLAALKGHVDVCKVLVENKADVLAKGYNALHLAALKGHVDVCKVLVENMADVLAKGYNGNHSLHQASLEGQASVCEYLIVCAGADVGACNEDGNLTLHLAALKGHVDVCKVLVENKADVLAKGYNGNHPLHRASLEGQSSVCEYLIVCAGADVGACNKDGDQALHLAAWKGHVDVCMILVEKKADVLAKGFKHRHPLHAASLEGHASVCEYLIACAGTNISACDEDGDQALHLAASTGKESICRLLLEINSGLLKAKNNQGEQAIHRAFRQRQSSVFSCLLALYTDADLNEEMGIKLLEIVNTFDRLPSELASMVCSFLSRRAVASTVIQQFCETLGKASICVGDKDSLAYIFSCISEEECRRQVLKPWLIAASLLGKEEIVEWLVFIAGADVDVQDESGKPVFLIAAEHGHRGTCDILLSGGAGADTFRKDTVSASTLKIFCDVLSRRREMTGSSAASLAKNVFESLCSNSSALSSYQNRASALRKLVSSGYAQEWEDNVHSTSALKAILTRLSEKMPSKKREDILCLCWDLVRIGANVYCTDKEQKTLLHYAASAGLDEMCRSLLERGASPLARDSSGKVAWEMASSSRHTELAAYLQKVGSVPDEILSQGGEAVSIYLSAFRDGAASCTFFRVDVVGKDGSGKTNILVLADRYLVESLRDFCIAHLARRVSKETAFDYLSLAERFGFRELKKVAVHFVAKNFKTLCRDDNFAGLGGELLAEIVRAIASSS